MLCSILAYAVMSHVGSLHDAASIRLVLEGTLLHGMSSELMKAELRVMICHTIFQHLPKQSAIW